MSEKCCGNCRFFGSEDLGGHGECQLSSTIRYCGDSCISYRPLFDSWTEITPDNVGDLYPVLDRVVVAYKLGENLTGYSSLTELYKPLKDLALTGGYYFFVLPELKIE